MTATQKLLNTWAKFLGATPESITERLFKTTEDGTPIDELVDDAEDILTDMDAERIGKLTAEVPKAKKDEIHKEATFQAKSKAQAKFQQQYGVEGKDLDEVVANAIKKASTVTEDTILTSPQYKAALSERDEKIASLQAEKETAVADVTARFERQSRFTQNLSKIDATMSELGVVMPANPTAAATLKREFLKQFDAFDFDERETGTYLKDSTGELLKDKHQNPVTLQSFVKTKAPEWFDIQKQPARETPGAENGGQPNPATKWTKDNLPKSKDEFSNLYFKTPDAERGDLMKAYQEANPQEG